MKSVMLWFMMALLVALAGCKGCEEDVKPDPCKNYRPVKASFKTWNEDSDMRDDFYKRFPQWVNFDLDTINGALSFIAEAHEPDNPTKGVEYLWEIGAETFTTRRVSRRIPDPAPPFIDIKLTVTRRPDTTCNPLDSGIAHHVKRLYFVNRTRPFFGKWFGYINDNPNDTVTLEIGAPGPLECHRRSYFSNFPVRHFVSILLGSGPGMITDYQLAVSEGGNCVGIIGNPEQPTSQLYLIIDKETGIMKADGYYWPQIVPFDRNNVKIRKFTGRKIQ
jgi:hypothetical protein